MDLSVLEPGLAAWVATLTGVDPLVVVWENAPRVRPNGVLVLLSCPALAGLGVDERRWSYDDTAPALEEMIPSVTGPRVLTLSVSAETHAQTAGANARAVLETMRSRLRWPSSTAVLRALNAGLVDAPSLVKADYRVDQHWISRYVLDVRLNVSSYETDLAGRTSALLAVDTTATITRPDGAAVGTTIQPGGTLP